MCYRTLTICSDCNTKEFSEPMYCDKLAQGKLCLITGDESYMSSLVSACILSRGELDITILIPVHVIDICKEVCATCILFNMNKARLENDITLYNMSQEKEIDAGSNDTNSDEALSNYSYVYDSTDDSSWIDEAFINETKC